MKCKYLEHQVCIRPDGEFRLCCISLEPHNKENITNTTIEEWNKRETITKAKEQLANGEFPSACAKCKYLESKGQDSMRNRPREYGPGISHLDLRFSNQCNLRCTMCFPGSSSGLYQEHFELLDKGLESPWVVSKDTNYNWFTNDRADQLASNPDLREVYLTGGEPMMVKGLDYFISKLDPSVELRFNTNGTLFNPKIYEQFKRFENINLCVSVDGVGKVNDYIRWGSDFTKIEENIKRWQDVADVNVGPTIQIMNILYADEYIEWADKNNLQIWDNLLINPPCLNIKNAPDSIKNKITIPDYLYAVKDKADIKQFSEFKKWITIFDKNRNVSIKDYLPEVAECYGM